MKHKIILISPQQEIQIKTFEWNENEIQISAHRRSRMKSANDSDTL